MYEGGAPEYPNALSPQELQGHRRKWKEFKAYVKNITEPNKSRNIAPYAK
jgi:hypothetical protein